MHDLERLDALCDALEDLTAQLADRVTYIEDTLGIVHPPAPWAMDVPGPDTYDAREDR